MPRIAGAVVLAILVALPAAAQTASLAAGATGSIRGTVYDSLLGEPLRAAQVWIVGTSLATTSDRSGRFTIDDVPQGRAVIAFSHPDLDSAGFSNNARRIDVDASGPTTVALFVPSRRTLYRIACDDGGGGAADSGVVFGAVADPRSGERLAGARVMIWWPRAWPTTTGVEVTRATVVAVTDSVGNYYVCGIPLDYVVNVGAEAGRFTSGTTELLLGPRGVARRDLGVSRDSLSLAADSAGAIRGRATIIGLVVDEAGRPVPDVRATVDDAVGQAATNERGVFVLSGLPAGSQMAMVRRIGYSAARQPVLLRGDDTVRVSFAVRALTMMDTIQIAGSSNIAQQHLLDDLEQRLRNKQGFILTRENIRGVTQIRSVLQLLPGMMLGGDAISLRPVQQRGLGLRAIRIYIDGISSSAEELNSYRPDQLLAVEWYSSGAFAPLQFRNMSNSGILLVWTKFIR